MKQLEQYLVCSKYTMGDMSAHTQLQDDYFKYTIRSHIGQAFKNAKVFLSNLKSNKMRAKHKLKLSFSFIFLTCYVVFKVSTFTNINLFGAICFSNFFSLALQSTLEILNDRKTCFVVFSFRFSSNSILNILFHSTFFSLTQ